MTAQSNSLADTSRSLLGVRRWAISRDQFFAGLYILGCINGLAGRVILAVNSNGWTGIFGVDISMIVLFACFAGITTILQQERDEITSADLAVGGIFLIPVALPIFALAWVAIAGLSLYILRYAGRGSPRQRGALILLVLTLPMLWGPLLLRFFSKPILAIDASLAALLLGTDWIGSMVRLADGSGYMVVTPACSSFTNISLAFLCFVSVTQWTEHRWSAIDILWLLLACASVIVVNVARISLTGLSHSSFEVFHSTLWENIAGAIILALAVGFSVLSVRRELFSRA